MATNFNKIVEEMANRAVAAQQQQNKGETGLMQMMRQLSAQRAPARSTGEAVGRGIREFIFPLLIQGAQQWKQNYDERGAKKDRADELFEMLKNGGQLSPQDQAFFEQMRQKYPNRYGNGQQQPATSQQLPPQQQQRNFTDTPLGQAIQQAAKMPNPDWQTQEARAQEQALMNAQGGAFSGADYGSKWAQDAQTAQQNLQQALRGNDEPNLLKWLQGRWQ